MFYNCLSLISLIIDYFDVSSVKSNYEYMFYNCYSLMSLNLTNFYTLSKLPSQKFISCNIHLYYCINDQKEYAFFPLLKNYTKSCFDICVNFNFKKYIIDNQKCIDNCSLEEIYNYEDKNICYKNPSYNSILINDPTNTTSHPSDKLIITTTPFTNDSDSNLYSSNKNGLKKSLIYIIIGATVTVFVIIISIIIICKICKKEKLIKIIFNEKHIFTVKYINPKNKIRDLISLYNQDTKNKNCKMFLYNGENLAVEENKNKKIEDCIPRYAADNEIVILVNDFLDLSSSSFL